MEKILVRQTRSVRQTDVITTSAPNIGRLRFDEALDDLINHHKANGRDTEKLEARIKKYLMPFFTKKKMTDITVPLINAYIAKRKKEVRVIPARTHHHPRARAARRQRHHQS